MPQPIIMGRASEILQPRPEVRPSAALPPPPPPRSSPEVATTSQTQQPPPPPPSAVDDASLLSPESRFLEMLPDSDLDILCEKHLGRVDGRWGRRRKIDELVAAGISGESAVQAPPPPPV